MTKRKATREGPVVRRLFLSRYSPNLMPPDALEAIFVQREKLAERLMDLVRQSALTPAKHHALLIGPRGIGKTHLIALLYHRLRAMEDLRDRLRIAWMREEEWGVTSFLDLLLRIFRALQEGANDPALGQRIESLYELDPKAAEQKACALLRECIGSCALLILAENLDDLFEGLGEDGQKRLRSFMQENPFMAIVATARGLFHGVSRQTSPFYGTFSIHHLEKLDLDEAARLLARIADYQEDRDLSSFIRTPKGRARIRAVQHLGGGNHRVYAIFSQFLTRESLDELVEPFMGMIDDLTPYYQSRIADLAPQQRKIVELLCDRRHAVPVREIAQRCFLTHQTASGQLKLLREKGYVEATAVGRESYYELREPLMRLCVEVKKHHAEPIRLLVDFLRLWHTREELESRSTDRNAPNTRDTELTVRNLLTRSRDPEEWPARVRSLVGVFAKHKALAILAQGLARSISALNSTMISQAAAEMWLDTWKGAAGDRPDFGIPLRLVDAAVRYRESPDPRILLGLAAEERSILKEALEIRD